MPKNPPYIPAKNAAYVNWLANFSTLIAASPATYGLAAGDATTITGIDTATATAYGLITSPSTKTATTVQAYNSEKTSGLTTIRSYAQMISKNAGVTPSLKISLGVSPNTSTPTPITAPTTAPSLTAVSTSPAGTILRYRDSTASPSVKAKPYGAIGVQLYGSMSSTPITDPTLLLFLATVTKSPLTVSLGSAFAGQKVYFAARWITQKGLVGPWSAITPVIVAG